MNSRPAPAAQRRAHPNGPERRGRRPARQTLRLLAAGFLACLVGSCQLMPTAVVLPAATASLAPPSATSPVPALSTTRARPTSAVPASSTSPASPTSPVPASSTPPPATPTQAPALPSRTPVPAPTVMVTAVPRNSNPAISLSLGPHLFLDDYLI